MSRNSISFFQIAHQICGDIAHQFSCGIVRASPKDSLIFILSLTLYYPFHKYYILYYGSWIASMLELNFGLVNHMASLLNIIVLFMRKSTCC